MKMRKIILLLAILNTIAFPCLACTTFFLQKNGQMVFGRNYDWVTATGMVNTNLRGVVKCTLPLEGKEEYEWVSKYGSITFNQYGKEFPNGGMNEKGLVVELMWLNESEYPQSDNRKPFSVLQWIQYQLDNCTTVDEVIATDEVIRIVSNGAPQHYLVADAKGNAATIEFLNGRMIVHRDVTLPYPVLANSTYESSLKTFEAINNGGGKISGDNSLDRFSTACNLVQQFRETEVKESLVDYSFHILDEVAQGDFTKWKIVYDITNKKIHFKTATERAEKIIDLNFFDLSCSAKPMARDMNEKESGMISNNFIPYSDAMNEKKLKLAFKESKSQISIPLFLQNAMANNASKVVCRN